MASPATVLHVDDDAGLRRLVEEVFADAAPELGYVAAGDPEAAIGELAGLRGPVILLLDRRLPGTDVWAFAERVADELGAAHLPTFILSGSRDPEAVTEAYERGAAAYLEKPMGADGFADVAELLARYADLAAFPEG